MIRWLNVAADGVTWGLVLACLFLVGHFAWTLFFPG